MGVYLAKPVTTKESEDGGSILTENTRYGVSCMQGWRQSMEDAHIAVPSFGDGVGVYGVFDGHGGPSVSAWVSKHFGTVFAEQLTKSRERFASNASKSKSESVPDDAAIVGEALEQTFLSLDEKLSMKESREELWKIHEHQESKGEAQEEDPGENSQQQFLRHILGNSKDGNPMVRIVERDGHRYFQVVSGDGDDEDSKDEDAEEASKIEEVFEDVLPEADATEETTKQEEAETVTFSAVDRTSSTNYASTHKTAPLSPADDVKGEDNDIEKEEEKNDEESEEERDEEKEVADSDDKHNAEDLSEMGGRGNLSIPENCGTTAVVVVVIGTQSSPYLVAANAGDSRAVLCREGVALALSEDHKPNNRIEATRISRAGGTVVGGRVDGNLNLSRAVGDLFYKRDTHLSPEEQRITSFPDVRVVPISEKDEFVILGCDGIWDCMSNQQAVSIVRERLAQEPNGEADAVALSKICEEMCDKCLSDNPLASEGIGRDNMTFMIVQLAPQIRKLPLNNNSPVQLYREESV